MRRTLRLALPLTFLGLAACAQQSTLPDATAITPEFLVGTQWEVSELYGQPVPGRAPTIAFSDDNRSHGYAGCNQFFGHYQLQGDAFSIDRIGSTRKLCEEERNQIEQRYLRGLKTVRQAIRQDLDLILLDEAQQVVVHFRPLTEAPVL